MVTSKIDITDLYNANGSYNTGLTGWDYAVVDVINPTGTVNFNTTSDSGDIQGVTDGNSLSAKNWQPVLLTNVANDARVSSAAATGNFRLNVAGGFLQLSGPSCGKIVINFSTIS